MKSSTLPLFPLHTVLFPGVVLPLQIFEPRYLDMVSACLKTDSGFGVVLLMRGEEIYRPEASASELHQVGTFARIVDWDRLPNGHLGIRVSGGERFRICQQQVTGNGLIQAEVEWLPSLLVSNIPEDFEALLDLWRELQNHPHARRFGMQEPTTAAALAGQLAQLLPLPDSEKMAVLEHDDPVWCLKKIRYWVARLAEGA